LGWASVSQADGTASSAAGAAAGITLIYGTQDRAPGDYLGEMTSKYMINREISGPPLELLPSHAPPAVGFPNSCDSSSTETKEKQTVATERMFPNPETGTTSFQDSATTCHFNIGA
jgi:hypothetical protein